MRAASSRLATASPRWRLPEPIDEARVARLAATLSLPPTLCRVLVARGLDEADAARHHLRPLLDHLRPPERLVDLDTAAQRLRDAIEAGERILVHGDYDVDGVCAAALLTRWLRRLGGRVEAFVPHRLRDGYDLGTAGLERARAAGARSPCSSPRSVRACTRRRCRT